MSIHAIAKNLQSQYINSAQFAEQIQISILSKISFLWYGKGGLGKSQMIRTAVATINCPSGILECTPDTSVSKLFGGAVALTEKYKEVSKEKVREYEITKESIDFDNGLLSYPLFILEEVLDAPFSTLAALKTVMTEKKYETHKSNNICLFGATNVDPKEFINELPPTYANSYNALLQRFLCVEHKWEDYSYSNYKALLDFTPSPATEIYEFDDLLQDQEFTSTVTVGEDIKDILAYAAEKSTEKGAFVSPRTLMWTVRLLKAHAYLYNRSKVSEKDLYVLKYIGSFGIGDIDKYVESLNAYKKAETGLNEIENSIFLSIENYHSSKEHKYIATGKVIRQMKELEIALGKLCIPDSLQPRKKQIQDKLLGVIREYSKIQETVAL